MVVGRQLLTRLAVADVVLFLVAAVFNDHSTTSVDGIIWWLAIALFAVLIVASFVVMVLFLRGRTRGRRRARTR